MTARLEDRDDDRFVASEPTRIGPYRLVQHLGEGGMGVVHLALDRSGRAVALKVLRQHIGHDPVARARLAREVETLERIRHPGVAPVLDADLDGTRPYIVTRFVDGLPLDEFVVTDGPLRGGDLLRLGRGLALAIRAIHAAGVVHRDIKPGNVLVVDGGDPVLIDFGIAHITDDVRLTSTGLVMGTPGYLSPEIVEGAEVTEATDWWGWAATVAFAALARPPFGSGPMEAVLTRVSGGQADLSGVDPRLAPLLQAALHPDASRRPDVEEVLAGLEVYARGGDVTQVITAPAAHTRVLPTPPPPPRPNADRPRAVAPNSVAPNAFSPNAAASSALASNAYAPNAVASPPVPTRHGESGGPEGDFLEAWQADRGDVPARTLDPRIGRPNRSGALAALLLLLVALSTAAPLVGLGAFLLWFLVARAADRSVTSLVLRRHASGIRRSDVPVAIASSPWHVLIGAAASLIGGILPAVVFLATAFSTALGLGAATGGGIDPAGAVPLAVGSLFAALTAWWGPMGAGLRRGTRSLVRGVTGAPLARQIVVALVLLGAAALAAWLLARQGEPNWFPGAEPPSWTLLG